jgi:NAD+ kinase
MVDTARVPKGLAIASSPQIPAAAKLTVEIEAFLETVQEKTLAGPLNDLEFQESIEPHAVDMLVVLGGDGTMLRAGHLCGPLGIPILGINLGRFGFLTEVQQERWQPALQRVLKGDYWLEERMMLKAEHYRDGDLMASWDVLNEAVVGRGEIVRPVRLETEIDDLLLTTYVADGVIVSTATGSTAYALAAGGPILPPTLRNILLLPLAPHLSIDRAIVLHEGSWVRVTVYTDHQASMSIDGQPSIPLRDGDQVKVRAGEHVASFVRLQDPGYFYRNLTSNMNKHPSVGIDE